MANEVQLHDTTAYIRAIRKELLRELRREAVRVRKHIRSVAPKESGNLADTLKVKTGVDATGPWARVLTGARRTTKNEETGEKTTFRYGLAIQQRTQYLERGLQRTPRR